MSSTYAFGGASSLIRHARAQGLGLSELPSRLPAEAIASETHRPVVLEPDFGLERPLVWINPASEALVVDTLVVEHLSPVDATGLAGDATEIVRFRAGVWSRLEPRKFMEFLLEADVITTYWHVGSTLELVEENRTGERYQARLVGTHEYFTHGRNVASLDFSVLINAEGAWLERSAS